MKYEKMEVLLRGQTVTAQKVYMIVPDDAPVKRTVLLHRNRNEFKFGIPSKIFDGCLVALKKSGLIREPEADHYVRVPVVSMKIDSVQETHKECVTTQERETPAPIVNDTGIDIMTQWTVSWTASKCYTRYDPHSKVVPLDVSLIPNLVDSTLVKAAIPGDTFRYPKGGIYTEVLQTHDSVIASAITKATGYITEIHRFRQYTDYYVTDMRSSDSVEMYRMATLFQIRLIMAASKLEEYQPNTAVTVPTTAVRNETILPNDWLFSLVGSTTVEYLPDAPVVEGKMKGTMLNYVMIRDVPSGTIARYSRPAHVTDHELWTRLYTAVRSASLKSGRLIEAHVYRLHVDIYVTGKKLLANSKLGFRSIRDRKELIAEMQLSHENLQVVAEEVKPRTKVTESQPVAEVPVTATNETAESSTAPEITDDARQFWRRVFLAAFPGMEAGKAASEATVAMNAYLALGRQ